MAITRLGGANAITGTIPTSVGGTGSTAATLPASLINNTSIGNVTALPAGISTGKVLQVVTSTHSTQTSTTSDSYVSTNLDASITPSSSSNKVLVLVAQNGVYKDGSGNGVDIELRRAGSGIAKLADNAGGENNGTYSIGTGGASCFLDSPSTSSSVSYETFFKRTGSDGAAYVQVFGCTSIITLMEIAG